jgi:hypothetical protein
MLMHWRHIPQNALVTRCKDFRNTRVGQMKMGFFFYPKHYRTYFIPILKYYNQTRRHGIKKDPSPGRYPLIHE